MLTCRWVKAPIDNGIEIHQHLDKMSDDELRVLPNLDIQQPLTRRSCQAMTFQASFLQVRPSSQPAQTPPRLTPVNRQRSRKPPCGQRPAAVGLYPQFLLPWAVLGSLGAALAALRTPSAIVGVTRYFYSRVGVAFLPHSETHKVLNISSFPPFDYAINRFCISREMATSYAQHSQTLQDFHRWRHSPQTRTPGLGGSNLVPTSFISRSKLEAYLETSRLEDLLHTVLNNDEIPAVAVAYVREHYLRCFATLLCINKGEWICHFQQYRSLRDEKMPYDTRPEQFPFDDRPDLFETFKAAQWQFCAMSLQYDMKDRFRDQDILPITSKKEIGRGGSATIYMIDVDESYHALRPPDQLLTV